MPEPTPQTTVLGEQPPPANIIPPVPAPEITKQPEPKTFQIEKDPSLFYSEAYNSGVKKTSTDLINKFGTDNLDEIAAKIKAAPPKPDNKTDTPEYKELLKSMEEKSKIADQSNENAKRVIMENKMLRHIPDAQDPDMVLYKLNSVYVFKEEGSELQAYFKSNDLPAHDGNGKIKTISNILDELRKDPKSSGLFIPTGGMVQPDPSNPYSTQQPPNGALVGYRQPTVAERTMPAFHSAVEKTGQGSEFRQGKDINMTLITQYM